MIRLTKTCYLCGEKYTLDLPITEAQFYAWQSGIHVNICVPELDPELKTQLNTGVHPKCEINEIEKRIQANPNYEEGT